MSRKRRNRIRLCVAICLVIFLLLIVQIRLSLYPMMDEMAVIQVENKMSDIVNDGIYEMIQDKTIDYDAIIQLETDQKGNVTALQTDMSQVNLIKTKLLKEIGTHILGMNQSEISLPIGNLILPELFAGRGFSLPVRLISITNSDAYLENQFSQGGINQTIHQLVIHVVIDAMIVTPAGTQMVQSTTQMVVAETVIVGTVPESYLNM